MDAAPHAMDDPQPGQRRRPQCTGMSPFPLPAPALCSPLRAPGTCTHTRTHPRTLFQTPKFTNSWHFCEVVRAVPDVTEN